jgi:outer membrane protein OmpA-like peptidoglycan-associated protein
MILKRYQKEQDINTKAQESYFYTKTRQFKAGLLSANELEEAKKAIKPDNWEITDSIYNILFSKNSSTLKVTSEEKESLKNKLNNLKQRYSDVKFTVDLQLTELDDLLNSGVPCLEKIN